MSRVDELVNAQRGYGRIWKDFIEAYQIYPDHLFCFFEGNEDPRYYALRIDNIIFTDVEKKRKNLCCKGKGNLILLFNLLSNDSRYSSAWTAFFVDKDFDDLSELPVANNVYITDCYSIENFYITLESFSKILQDEFTLSPSDTDYQSTINLFQNHINLFNVASEEINAWIFIQRSLEKNNPGNYKMNLDDVHPEKLFLVNIHGVQKLYNHSKLEELFPQARKVSHQDLDIKISDMKTSDVTKIFRGKYLIYFLKKILSSLAEDSNKNKNRIHFSEKRKVQLSLSDNIISELSMYASTPESLVVFLRRIASIQPITSIIGKHNQIEEI